MALSGRWRRIEESKALHQAMELTIPIHFMCPISLDLMKDPVTLSSGITYDRESIERWIDGGKATCPVTNQLLWTFDLIPNHFLRKMIQDWCVENRALGVERIPTPRIPVAPNEVSAIRSRMEAAMQSGHASKCRELLGKIDQMAKESERNKRCITSNGITSTLTTMFESFARSSIDSNIILLGEILSVLTWTSPLDQQGIASLKSDDSLLIIVRFLKCEDNLSSRQNAICVLKELISVDQGCLERLMGIEGIEETLFHLVKVPINPKATKASLVIIHHMIASSAASTMKFVQMGLLPLILEMLVDCDKSLCERVLGVVDSICSWKQGRKSSYDSALTIPVLVKKLLRISNAATEFTVSTLWKLCLGENKNALVEAVQFGVFQKLLVVLQIQISEETKEKVTDLLKLINLNRDQLDCFDSSLGFCIKRSDDLQF